MFKKMNNQIEQVEDQENEDSRTTADTAALVKTDKPM